MSSLTCRQATVAGLVGASASYFTNAYTFKSWTSQINKVEKNRNLKISDKHETKNTTETDQFEFIMKPPMMAVLMGMPFIYAGFNIGAAAASAEFDKTWQRVLITGAVGSGLGLFLSTTGRYLDLPRRVFNVKDSRKVGYHPFHVGAPVLYFLFFAVVVSLVNEIIVFQEGTYFDCS